MKKILIFLMVGMFMLSLTSAFFEFDNYYTYDEKTRIASFKNGLTFGSSIGQVKLNTPLDMKVAPGYNYVFEVEIWGDVDYSNFIKDMYVHDINSSYDLVGRDIDLKYFNGYETKFRDIRGCLSEVVSKNGTRECVEYGIVETREYEVEVWDDFSEKNLKENDHLVVRGYTNVELDDKMEWYIDFFGAGENTDYGTKGVKEWASWTASLNVDIISFWKFNSTSGVVLDSLNINNGTNNGAIRGADGIINASFDYNGTTDFVNISNGIFDGLSEFTISYWINPDNVSTGLRRVFRDQSVFFTGYDNGLIAMFADTVNVDVVLSVAITHSIGTWVHIVATYNDSLSILYEDGVQVTNASANGAVVSSSGIATFGSRDGSSQFWDGRIDEVGFWNRSLTPAEVQQLYNNGSAITFTTDFEVIQVTLNEPLNDTQQTNSLVEFNWTITPTSINITNWTLSVFFDNGTLLLQEINTTINTNLTTIVLHNETIADGDYIWNVESCGTDIGDVCDLSENRTFSIDTSIPLIIIEAPSGLLNFNFVGGTETLNVTFNDSTLDTCWFDYNGTNITIDGCVSGVKNSTTFILEENNFNMTVYANDSSGNENSSFTNWSYKVFLNSQTFNNPTTEGNTETFSANITLLPSLSISVAALIYNGTGTVGISTPSGLNTIISVDNVIIPGVNANTNLSFFWALLLSDSTPINLTTENQTVLALGIDNCTTFTNAILNFTNVDEELQTLLQNSTIETAVNIFSADGATLVLNVSGISIENPTAICLSDPLTNESSYLMNVIVKYSAVGYAIEYFNIVNLDLNLQSSNQNITLFDLNLNDTTDFQLRFTGADFIAIENVLVFLERQYIAENTFKTVELPLTDSNGETVLHLVRNDIIYNIRFVKNGETLGVFENIIAFCQDFTIGNCILDLSAVSNESAFESYQEFVGISYTTPPSYNSTNNLVSFSFISEDGTTQIVEMRVERRDIFGNQTVCSNTIASSSGTLFCNIGLNLTETVLFTIISVDGRDLIFNTVIIDDSSFGDIGYAMWFIMTLFLIIMSSESKNALVIVTLISYIGALSMGWFVGGAIGVGSSGIWILIISAVAIWQINKERKS